MCRLLRPFAKEIALFERNNASLIAQPGESLVSQLKHSALSRTFQFPIVRISRGLNEMYAGKYIYIYVRVANRYIAYSKFSRFLSRCIEDGAFLKILVFDASIDKTCRTTDTCKSPRSSRANSQCGVIVGSKEERKHNSRNATLKTPVLHDFLQFYNCQCIGSNLTTPETASTATIGYCELECSNFWVYMVLFSVFVFIHSTSEVGSMLLILRCVDPRDKAMALGLIQFAIGLFGNYAFPPSRPSHFPHLYRLS